MPVDAASTSESSERDELVATLQKKVQRLERRLEREKKVRYDTEVIADRGMRELWLANRELDDRVERRTADLKSTLEQLERASSTRKKFLSTLSHEMRTPLNGVLGMLELLTPHLSDDQGREYLQTASQSADRLHRLIRRLLDLVEVEGGNFEPKRDIISVDGFADQIRQRWQQSAAQAGHLLTVSSSIEVTELAGDSTRLHQMVDELVDNAVTHASGGLIQVKLRAIDDSLCIEVIDTGPGIDPARIDSLFINFSMVDDSTQRLNEGLGLGLSLSRRVVEAFGGTLDLESDGKTSTTARLVVPVYFMAPKSEMSDV